MKKLFFLFAGALFALSSYAQAPAQTSDAQAAAMPAASTQTKWEGLCPDYGYPDGYLYAIFVKVEVNSMMEIVSVDPVLKPARQVYGEWEAAPEVLLDYRVWVEGGFVHYEVTYQYPGWPVRSYSSSFSYVL